MRHAVSPEDTQASRNSCQQAANHGRDHARRRKRRGFIAGEGGDNEMRRMTVEILFDLRPGSRGARRTPSSCGICPGTDMTATILPPQMIRD